MSVTPHLDPDVAVRMTDPSRRSMLRLCLVACVAAAGGGGALISMTPRGSGANWGNSPSGIGAFSRFSGAAAFGRSLRMIPRHATAARECLRSLQEGPILQAAGDPQMTRDALVALVSDHCRDDFRLGRIVVVDGWRLAETEVAICYLADALVRNEIPPELLA